MPRLPEPHQTLGEVLRRLREDAGLSQEAVADSTGLHRNYIGLVERAERNPSWNNVVRIADALGLSMADIGSQYENARARGKASSKRR